MQAHLEMIFRISFQASHILLLLTTYQREKSATSDYLYVLT